MKVALFLTAELAAAEALARRVRQQHPDAQVMAFVRDEHLAAIAAALPDGDVRRDKPVGGRLGFVRGLRRERFDLAVVAWHGGERLQPLRLVALAIGAARVVAVDERGKEMPVSWLRPWSWAGHALRRLRKAKALAILRLVAAVYRATLGALIAGVLLLPWLVRARLVRGVGPRS